ncbi:OmpA family protein [candidate division WOR-3 bacterium]|uniref:OmpA family protein n=1 Tax=candidate division WOR-3 bacterium TaxID=2052148 RepID=A0A938BNN0_UNCW3|nr:OmpA family protein [candidate division WOR-3 bacterium]
MRTRVSVLALLMAVLPAFVFAYPGFGGGKGLFRVQNAMVEEEAGLTISLHALARNADFLPPQDSPNASAWVADAIAPELSYAPIATKYVGLELFASSGGAIQMPKSYAEDGFTWKFGDLKAGGKLSVPVIPVLKIGGTASYTFMYRDTAGFLDPGALPYDPASKLAWSGLLTLQFQDVLPSAPNLIVNYGKIGGKTQYAAAVELQGKGFGLFVEGVSLQNGTDILGTTDGHLHLTPGVVLGNANGGFLKAGYTFSSGTMDSVKQPNEVIVGLGFATPFGRRTPAVYGTIVGTVTNASTGRPVAATIAFPDDPKMASITTDADGVFEARKAPVGAVTVEVSAEGYNRQAVPLAVEEDKVTNYAFKLRPLKTYGTIAGTVIDAVSSAPMGARIEFPGTALAPVNADPVTGAFQVDQVETGVYTITATADRHVAATITLAVEDNKLATASFKLSPAEVAVAATGRVSDKKTDAGLSATVTFDNALFNTDPATGVYKAQLMPGSYTVVVESKDYVKQTTALIVEKDKPFVRDFAMLKVGMSVTLKGIYFDFNLATIKPESKPALEAAANMLNENPTINVEIQGHTDSKGSDSYNLSLSDRRAASVVSYLVQNLGIDVSRLTSRGYGESMPIATNDTDAGRALNRRVEFKILGEK